MVDEKSDKPNPAQALCDLIVDGATTDVIIAKTVVTVMDLDARVALLEAEKLEANKTAGLDWGKAKKHLDDVKDRYAESMNTPGVNVSFALGGIMETERRFDKGERTQLLFDTMMEIK